MIHPKLRALEPVPTDGDRFYLRDPMRLSESILLVPRPVLFLLSLMDGARSKEDLLLAALELQMASLEQRIDAAPLAGSGHASSFIGSDEDGKIAAFFRP